MSPFSLEVTNSKGQILLIFGVAPGINLDLDLFEAVSDRKQIKTIPKPSYPASLGGILPNDQQIMTLTVPHLDVSYFFI